MGVTWLSSKESTRQMHSEPQRVLLVAGTRPEGIKLAPVWKALADRPRDFVAPMFCSTGQHDTMLDSVLDLFSIEPGWRLDVLARRPSLTKLTSILVEELADVYAAARPDWVVCQGDTTSAMCAALTAFYQGIRVAHVEAGLRTYDPRQPFPEEINRRLIAPMAAMHFAPTEAAADNLRAERIPDDIIHVTGNTVVDAVRMVLPLTQASPLTQPIREWYGKHIQPGQRLVLVTGHRRENWGDALAGVLGALREVVARHPDVVAIYPVHLNPLVRDTADRELAGQDRIHLLPPQDYASFTWLMSQACLILTDSGGIQEEGPGLGKPVLVFRNVTERPEGIAAGTARLVGTDPGRIRVEIERLLTDPAAYAAMARARNPYGDGTAAIRIAALLAGHPR